MLQLVKSGSAETSNSGNQRVLGGAVSFDRAHELDSGSLAAEASRQAIRLYRRSRCGQEEAAMSLGLAVPARCSTWDRC